MECSTTKIYIMKLLQKTQMKRRALKMMIRSGTLFTISLLVSPFTWSQTMVFADSIVAESEVDNSQYAIDNDLNTFSEVRANSGALLGFGAYSGYVEVKFPGVVPANQTSYIK